MNPFRWLGWLCGLLMCLSRLNAVSLLQGPTVESTPTNAVIRWETDTESGSRVQFGGSPNSLIQRVQGAVGTKHVVELKNLRPGQTYHYTVGTARYALATNSFSTLPLGSPGKESVPSVGDRPAEITPPSDDPAQQPRPPPTRLTWGSLRSLQDHFDRHGDDFSAKDPDDYAAQAWSFCVRAKKEGLPAKQDHLGVVRVFDPQTGAFAAYNRDGTTKTYFKPGRQGYFPDQPGRRINLRELDSFQPPQ